MMPHDSRSRLNPTNHEHDKVVDPVLPDQGGRLMASDPGHVIPTSEEDVRRHAYAKFEQRGREDGRALDDWLAAESEIVK
jgi:hypothetical protein